MRDEDVDSGENDEVQVDERISARTAQTALLRRWTTREALRSKLTPTLPSGPSRETRRSLPFIIESSSNDHQSTTSPTCTAVARTSRAIMSDQILDITANALVLPATSQEDQIQFESEDGVLVTGSSDLPDGFLRPGDLARGHSTPTSTRRVTAARSQTLRRADRASSAVSSYVEPTHEHHSRSISCAVRAMGSRHRRAV